MQGSPFRLEGRIVLRLGRLSLNCMLASAALGAAHAGAAQRADTGTVFRGRVVQQGSGGPIAGADVWLASSDRHATSDSTGAFVFVGVAAGIQLVQIRHVGFDARRDTLALSAEHENVRTYALTVQAAQLDTVRTLAGKQKYLSPMLHDFEERRLSHQGGHFVPDSVFRRNEGSTLAAIITSRVPGVTAQGGNRLISTRTQCRGLALEHSGQCKQGKQDCYVTIYLDGALYYTPPPADLPPPNGNNPALSRALGPPDLTKEISPGDLAGAEYYADGGSAPAGMHTNDQGCGTLWLWTRER